MILPIDVSSVNQKSLWLVPVVYTIPNLTNLTYYSNIPFQFRSSLSLQISKYYDLNISRRIVRITIPD